MENQNATEIICILDKSGSMEVLQQETVQGLNNFIEEQQQEAGNCNFSLVQFNQNVIPVIKRLPMQQVRTLGMEDYRPTGYTALLDAVGITLQTAIETVFYLPQEQVPAKVLVFIVTDGFENASQIYSRKQVAESIESLQVNKGWEFRFFGANVDAFAEASSLGIMKEQAVNWNFNKEGMEVMMKEMSETSSKMRKGL